jgi:hypothetical protein
MINIGLSESQTPGPIGGRRAMPVAAILLKLRFTPA